MTDLSKGDSTNLDGFVLTTGVEVTANRTPTGATQTLRLQSLGCTLALNTTYVFPFGAPRAPVPREATPICVGVRWDASIIMTISIEDAVFSATYVSHDPRGEIILPDYDSTAGYWIPENPDDAYVAVVGGTFNAADMTVSVAGGSAGGCVFHLGNFAAPRGRVKLAVGGTGGGARVGVHGKASA